MLHAIVRMECLFIITAITVFLEIVNVLVVTYVLSPEVNAILIKIVLQRILH